MKSNKTIFFRSLPIPTFMSQQIIENRQPQWYKHKLYNIENIEVNFDSQSHANELRWFHGSLETN